MLLSQRIANFTKGDADKLRRAMGKKKKQEMDALKAKFMKGGNANGHSSETLEKIWKDWEAFAAYAFNKSHSTCYAFIGYQTAYLKANYPAEYMAATLSRNLNDMDEITKLMDECKRMGIAVLGPDVNESSNNFIVNKKGDIRFGMAGIKGVGSGAVDSIVNSREEGGNYSSIFNFVERINLNTVNRKTIESLIYAGAFDSFEPVRREQYLANTNKEEPFLDALIKYGSRFQSEILNGGNSLFGKSETIKLTPPDIPQGVEVNQNDLLKKEKELVGMYLSAHPLDQFAFEVKHFTTHTLVQTAELVEKAPADESLQRKDVIIAGIVTNVKISYTKTQGRPFANFTIEDFNGSISFSVFGKDYENFMQYFQPNLPLLMKCTISPKFGYGAAKQEQPTKNVDYELKIKSIRHLANTKDDFIKQITINIPIKVLNGGFRKELIKSFNENKGNTAVIIKALDYEAQLGVEFFSTKYKVSLNKEFFNFLESIPLDYSFTPTLSF